MVWRAVDVPSRFKFALRASMNSGSASQTLAVATSDNVPPDAVGSDVLDVLVRHPLFVQHSHSRIQFRAARDYEAEVVEAGPVLIESVRGNWAQPEQRVARLVDDASEEEGESLSRLLIEVGGS